MTDKEIIKALECCAGMQNDCVGCPLIDFSSCEECMSELISNALDLINRQQEKIEYMQGEREVLLEDIYHSANQINEQQTEIEKLEEKCSTLEYDIGLMQQEKSVVETEAIKEFAEYVLSLFPEDKKFTVISRGSIKRKAKEMVGEGE